MIVKHPFLYLLFLVIDLVSVSTVFGQTTQKADCDCLEAFTFISDYVEKNQASFQHVVTADLRPAYETFKRGIRRQIQKEGKSRCSLFLHQYMAYFKDHHSQVHTASTLDVNDPDQLKAFLASAAFRNTETVVMDSARAYAYVKHSNDPVEGIYDLYGSYQVLIQKNKNAYRDYYGVLLQTKSPTWKPGQVKLELKRMAADTYQYQGYLQDHSLSLELLTIDQPVTRIGEWTKLYPVATTAPNHAQDSIPTALTTFKLLDDSTAYLSIRTFSREYLSALDSTFQALTPVLQRTPYLLIDVRDNGGGSSLAYQRLLPLLYTHPSTDESFTEYLATSGIIEQYENLLKNSPNPALTSYRKDLINQMKQVPEGTFIRLRQDQPKADTIFKSRLEKPRKVVILYNRNCGSSCETFVLAGMRSKKVVTVGENSGGYIGYGNIMTIPVPNSAYVLESSTTRNPALVQYEYTGIPPMRKVPAQTSWIDFARQELGTP